MSSKPEQLMQEALDGEAFDARAYFMGKLSALGARGFERMQDEAVEAWLFDVPPFYLWAFTAHGGDVVNISAELVLRGERTALNLWSYPVEELDAALAQVDRVQPMLTQYAGVPGRDEVCVKLRKMGKAPGVNEDEDVDDFSAATYLNYEEQLKQMGFKHVEGPNCYTKSYPVSGEGAQSVFLSVSLFYNTPNAFVDVYVSAQDASKAFLIIKHVKSVPANDVYTYVDRVSHVAHKLAQTGFNSAQQVAVACGNQRLLEAEQEFDSRDYFLNDPLVDTLEKLGYDPMSADPDAFSKLLFIERATYHYLWLYTRRPNEPGKVQIEYQKHVPMIGYVYVWGVWVDNHELLTFLPLLESAIQSASDQEMTEVETKAVLNALVK